MQKIKLGVRGFITVVLMATSLLINANEQLSLGEGPMKNAINLKALPPLDLATVPSYDVILAGNEARLKKLNPNYTRQAGSDATMLLEAQSYRELALRTEVAGWVKDLFWMTATGNALDYHAGNVGLQRLAGSKPTADYTFSLSTALAYDITIPKGTVLGDSGGTKTALVLANTLIPAGQSNIITKVELQEFTPTNQVKTQAVLTPLPFVISAKANADFTNGATRESDEALRNRINLSFADKSTAGAMRTYISYTFRADSRIKDVNVVNKGAGKVEVIYFAEVMDDVMRDRVTKSLNAEDVRPLTDIVTVKPANVVHYDISASLLLEASAGATVQTTAVNRLKTELAKKQTIQNKVHLSDIIALLKIEGIDDVQLSKPTKSLTAKADEVLVANNIQITQMA